MKLPKWKNITLESKILLLIGVGIFFVLIGTTPLIISTVTSQEENLAYNESRETAKRYANQLNGDMQSSMAIARTIAVSMPEYNCSQRQDVNIMLEKILIENPKLTGVYVVFEPDAFDGNDSFYINTSGHDSTGRFIPYWNTIGGTAHLDPMMNYETYDYYQLPKKSKNDVITEPYTNQNELVVSYVSPILRGGEFIGVAGVDISLNYIDGIVNDIEIFNTGYGFLVSNTGILLSHPTEKEWIGKSALDELAFPNIETMCLNIKNCEEGYIETIDPATGDDVLMFYEPLDTGNFSFILVVPKDEMLAGIHFLRLQLMVISGISVIIMGAVGYGIAKYISISISKIVSDFKDISDDALKGNLYRKANTDVDIDFRVIPEGLNEILDALQKANASKDRLEKIIRNSPAIVFEWEYGSNLHTRFVSKNVLNIGYSSEEFLSGELRYEDVIHPDDRNKVHEDIDRNIALNVDDFSHEYRIIKKNGEIRWVEELTTIIKDDDGNVKALQGIIVDISDRKEAEKALIEANMIAESANETKSQFLANMSHELRTPLNSIIGFSDILANGTFGDLNEKQTRYVGNILRSGKHLLEIINDILDISKVEAGKMELTPETFRIGGVLKELFNTLEPFAMKKNIELLLVMPDENIKVYADRLKTKQILYNLLSNAIKFTPNEGKVGVEVHATPEDVRISVFDTGIGISDEDIDKLFEPFKQLDSATAREYQGTGLGLTLVKKFVEMHGGKIWVESKPEKGSSFTFTIPVQEYE